MGEVGRESYGETPYPVSFLMGRFAVFDEGGEVVFVPSE